LLLSLFCGPGGLDTGFEKAGFEVGLAFDIRKTSVETYNNNRPAPNVAYCRDISDLTLSELDALHGKRFEPKGVIGGPPCQSFSFSNVFKSEGDLRSQLPLKYAQLLKQLNKRSPVEFFLFENVLGLLSERHREEFEIFRNAFKKAGFLVNTVILNAVDFGVPQVRQRVFIIGFNKKIFKNINVVDNIFDPFKKDKVTTVRDVLFGLPEPVFFNSVKNKLDIPFHPNHWCMTPKSRKFTTPGALIPGKTFGRSFRVLEWDKPSPTVAYGHREVHVHPSCRRRLSVFEAMRLQGFPDSYVLSGNLSDQITQVSEAIPPSLGYVLAKFINNYIKDL
jgi:DNA (cytosine-5)-methyltransferase 1